MRCSRLAYYPTKRSMVRSLLVGQGIITLFVLINLFVPREYHQVVMILYFVVFTAIFGYSTIRRQRGGAKLEDIRSGRRVLVITQKEVADVQSKDLELVGELKPLLKASGLSMLSLVVAFAWFFFLYPSFVGPYITASGDDVLWRVVALLVLYEVPVATSFFVQMSTRRLVKRYVNVLRGIEVYTSGVIGVPGLSLKFPLQGYTVRVSFSRKFVEFVRNEGGIEVLHRVYAMDVERLAELISRYGRVKVERVS